MLAFNSFATRANITSSGLLFGGETRRSFISQLKMLVKSVVCVDMQDLTVRSSYCQLPLEILLQVGLERSFFSNDQLNNSRLDTFF